MHSTSFNIFHVESYSIVVQIALLRLSQSQPRMRCLDRGEQYPVSSMYERRQPINASGNTVDWENGKPYLMVMLGHSYIDESSSK